MKSLIKKNILFLYKLSYVVTKILCIFREFATANIYQLNCLHSRNSSFKFLSFLEQLIFKYLQTVVCLTTSKLSKLTLFVMTSIDVLHVWEVEQKQPSRGVFIKRCSGNMQQIFRRTPMPKCDFNKVTKQLY